MKRPRVVLLLALAGLLTITSSAFADSNVRIVRLSYVQGSVLIDQGTGNGFMKATMNMPVSSSTRIRTGDTGLAEVQFEEGATLRLVGETSVLFQPLLLTNKGMRVSGIAVGEGTVYINVRNAKHDRFFLNVHGTPLEISTKTHLRISADQKQVLIAIYKGSLTDSSTGHHIGSGDSLRIDQQSNTITDIAKGIDPFATDAWDQERDKYYQNPTANSNLATTSVAFAPSASTGDLCMGLGPSAFGLWVPGCGYWDQGYGYWNPYSYVPYSPSNTVAATHPKPKPPNPHGDPQDEQGLPKTAVILPASPPYANSVRPLRGTSGVGVSQVAAGTPAAFTGSRPGLPGSAVAVGQTAGARWTPVSPSRPSRSGPMGNSGVSSGARGSYSGSYSGGYAGGYSGGYAGGSSSAATAPSRPSPSSYSPPPVSSAPATAPVTTPVAAGRPGR